MVIQRLQSLYLLLAALLLGLFSFMPFLQFTTERGIFLLSPLSIEMKGIADQSSAILNQSLMQPLYSWGYFSISVIIAIIILITIFKYKSIKFQKKLTWISLVLTICFFASIGIYSTIMFGIMGMTSWSLCFSAVFIPLSIILIAMSIYRINKDIKVLNSYDRIR